MPFARGRGNPVRSSWSASAVSHARKDSRATSITPINVLSREKQIGVVRELTDIVAAAAGDPTVVDRTWVLIYESPDGGWGINGHANTGADIAVAARAELAAIAAAKDEAK
jgi:phenylpyruvate tautomerase PptA (4-oxalocrotonate tautomerase family)